MTENGAIGYRTTGKALVDLGFCVSSLRKRNPSLTIKKFEAAFAEDALLAVKWLFFAADVRGGMGERRLFEICLRHLALTEPDMTRRLLPLVPEYTRWDRLFCLTDTELRDDVLDLVAKQFALDEEALTAGKPVSLLCKWLPSINASSERSRELAKVFMKKLSLTAKQYRQKLSALRRYVGVIEVAQSAGKWNKINYSEVPSRANLLYKEAFLRHDERRRKQFLRELEAGRTKINAGTLFPHDICAKYRVDNGRYCDRLKKLDPALEGLWKALPDYVEGSSGTLCVADGSGSMLTTISRNGDVTYLDVADALAIYFSERCKGQYRDTYITFSENPQIVSFAKCKTLREKLRVAFAHNEVANTDIEAVFDLILATAVNNDLPQSDLPQNVLVLSDMEFDYSVRGSDNERATKKLFSAIAEKYTEHGYTLPRLVFWNLGGRTDTIPIKNNAAGVALVSGFGPAALKAVLSSETDPYKCLMDMLGVERYDAVEKAFLGKQSAKKPRKKTDK